MDIIRNNADMIKSILSEAGDEQELSLIHIYGRFCGYGEAPAGGEGEGTYVAE